MSFWFLPSVIVAVGIVLAVTLIGRTPPRATNGLPAWPRLFVASAAGARGMLSAIARSMIQISRVQNQRPKRMLIAETKTPRSWITPLWTGFKRQPDITTIFPGKH
jgi:hypothetical protein